MDGVSLPLHKRRLWSICAYICLFFNRFLQLVSHDHDLTIQCVQWPTFPFTVVRWHKMMCFFKGLKDHLSATVRSRETSCEWTKLRYLKYCACFLLPPGTTYQKLWQKWFWAHVVLESFWISWWISWGFASCLRRSVKYSLWWLYVHWLFDLFFCGSVAWN